MSKHTTLHEFMSLFSDCNHRVSTTVDYAETCRLLDVLRMPAGKLVRFYGVNELEDGLATFISLKHISKINILDSLPGIEFQNPNDLPADKQDKITEERVASDQRVVVRLFTRLDKHPVVIYDVKYADWHSISSTLEVGEEDFIWLVDNDGERVVYPVRELRVVEMFDPYFRSEDQLDEWIEKYEENETEQGN